ncbi:glucan endo-1,3-beta-glucosidase 14-like [Miscanthus floridulus]|uniref:glucan endo-1,3-beta-glucosidase 14-like n=1 Tax=Miscanthus floridulus TaxID=154761 RepID=UPI003459D297
MATAGRPSRTALSLPAPSCNLAAACCFVLLVVPILLTDQQVAVAESLSIGVNYGQIASNLPSPEQVSWLLRSMRISKVKLYDADPNVLRAFLGTGVEFVVGIGNEYVPAMVSPAAAQAWLQQHVVPYLRAGARITCVTVGNEVFKQGGSNDTVLQAAVLPAMQSVHRALGALGLQGRVNVTTAHSLDIMGVSFPPSAGAFHPAALAHLQPFLGFLSATRAPFLINCYPYFAYKDDPARVPLDYVLFRPNAAGVVDARTGLRYDNMLYAQVDAVYAAIQGLGYTDVEVKVSETGWPSRGDADEPGATPEYAGTYIRNLLQRIEMKQGTPLRPATPVDVYVFALFNENLKPGPASERNYGLFYPDGTPVYNVGLHGYLPPMLVSSSTAARQVIRLFAPVAIASVAFVLS